MNTLTGQQIDTARRIGYAIGASAITLTFANLNEVAAGRYPQGEQEDAAVTAMYAGIRQALLDRQPAEIR